MAGNKLPKVYPNCLHCGERFGPRDRKAHVYCSRECAYAHRTELPKKPRRKPTAEARRAQNRVGYLIKVGRLVRPDTCEECGQQRNIEAAHRDYSRPEDILWLCIPCHRRMDWASPNGGMTPR